MVAFSGFFESPGPPSSEDARYCTVAPPWLSKRPATEVLLFVVAAFFAWHNHSKEPCYGSFKLMPSYYIIQIGVISLFISYLPPPPTMDAILATIGAFLKT